MKGDDHAILSMATALFCMAPFATTGISPESLCCGLLFLGGVFAGSHLPDSDVVAARGLHLKTCAGFVISCISIGMVSVVRVVYRVAGCRFDGRHRESLHTVFGVFVAVGVIAVFSAGFFADAGWWSNRLLWVYAGLLCGGLLHLAEDCCTVSGLRPFMPLSPLHLKGGINTGDRRDQRPVWYAKYLVCMTAGVIAVQYVFQVPSGTLFIPVLSTAALSWFFFCLLSRHHIHPRRR